MQIGSVIQVHAYKANGLRYRTWDTIIETVSPECVVTVSPVGHIVKNVTRDDWVSPFAIRTYYWPARPYSLLEVYKPDGELAEIYVNISSPVEIAADQVQFTDYELDAVFKPPGPANVVDEDEFSAAAVEYGYSEEFKRWCYQTVDEALVVANQWQAKGMPIPQE